MGTGDAEIKKIIIPILTTSKSKIMQSKKLKYTQTHHMLNYGDYQNVILEIKYLGVSFYQPMKLKSLFDYSHKLAKWAIFRVINRINKSDAFESKEVSMCEKNWGFPWFTKQTLLTYDTLPEDLRDKLFKAHQHGDSVSEEDIVYKESDVIDIINYCLASNDGTKVKREIMPQHGKPLDCEDCQHRTPRHSIICSSCSRFSHFEAKHSTQRKCNPLEFTKTDMKAAFDAGSNKKCWTDVKMKGSDPVRLPVFDEWFEKHY